MLVSEFTSAIRLVGGNCNIQRTENEALVTVFRGGESVKVRIVLGVCHWEDGEQIRPRDKDRDSEDPYEIAAVVVQDLPPATLTNENRVPLHSSEFRTSS